MNPEQETHFSWFPLLHDIFHECMFPKCIWKMGKYMYAFANGGRLLNTQVLFYDDAWNNANWHEAAVNTGETYSITFILRDLGVRFNFGFRHLVVTPKVEVEGRAMCHWNVPIKIFRELWFVVSWIMQQTDGCAEGSETSQGFLWKVLISCWLHSLQPLQMCLWTTINLHWWSMGHTLKPFR